VAVADAMSMVMAVMVGMALGVVVFDKFTQTMILHPPVMIQTVAILVGRQGSLVWWIVGC
jgi:hypothetical protein